MDGNANNGQIFIPELPTFRADAFLNVENLSGDSDKLFMSIRSGDHAEAEMILADRGHEVEVVPRIGCSPLHYTKFNVANREADNGDTPLIMAARVDSRMVKIVLKYGGNPNHANKERDTPLSVAAGKLDKESIEALLLAGANLRAAVAKLISLLKYISSEEQLQGYSDLACSVKPLTVLLSDDVYLRCRCPIKAAFEVGRDIAYIKNVRNEFQVEFELLIEDSDRFAFNFLNTIDKMWEAKEILIAPVDLIKMAIDQKKKRFISHPFNQQIINGRWFGDLANRMFLGQLMVALEFIVSPFLVLPLFFKFLFFDNCKGTPVMRSSFGRLLKMKFTPCLCFATDVMNYIMFLTVLTCVCLMEQDSNDYTVWEWLLYACVLCRVSIELDNMMEQGWRIYFANAWNHVDISILVLLIIAAVSKKLHPFDHYQTWRDYIQSVYDHSEKKRIDEDLLNHAIQVTYYQHFLKISYMYAVAEFVLFLRFLTLLEITRSMGPLLIALKYLLLDVLKFSVVLFTVVLGTSITIYSMNVRLESIIYTVNDLCEIRSNSSYVNKTEFIENVLGNLTEDTVQAYCDKAITGELKAPPSFQNFHATLSSIMWSTFGLFDVENVSGPYESSTISFINIILVLYILLSCVMLLNMLIGILSATLDRIQNNCDMEWKYARSETLTEYSGTQPFLIPFCIFLLPLVYWFRRKMREEEQRRDTGSPGLTTEQGERDKIVSQLCERFKSDYWEEDCAARPRSRAGAEAGTRQGNFDARVRRLRAEGTDID